MVEFFIAVMVILLDRVVNYWAATYLINIDTIPIIQDVFHLTYATNTGAAFSMFRNHTFILGFVSATIIIGLVVYLFLYRRNHKMDLMSVSIAMIIGGAFANMIDRFFRGYVVDYFDFRLINFAVFNIADSFVVIGVSLMILDIVIDEYKKMKARRA